MNILVLGGSSFKGANFISYLLEKYKDYRVVCIDSNQNFADEDTKRIQTEKMFNFYQIDLTNREELIKVFNFWFGFDFVVNFTDHVNDRSVIEKTCEILDILKKYRTKKYLHVSTSLVYGSGINLEESAVLDPRTIEVANQASSDLIALSYYYVHDVQVVVARGSNCAGRFQSNDDLFQKFVSNILNNKRVITKNNLRQWVYVYDYCRALDTILHYGRAGGLYNIGGEEVRDDAILDMIMKHLGKTQDMLEGVGVRLSDEAECIVNDNKIRELGWGERFHFMNVLEDVLEDVIDWCKNV